MKLLRRIRSRSSSQTGIASMESIKAASSASANTDTDNVTVSMSPSQETPSPTTSQAASPQDIKSNVSVVKPSKQLQSTNSRIKEIREDTSQEVTNSMLSSLRPLQMGSYDFDSPSMNNTRYKYPSLYSEASAMLQLSLLIYTLSELRDMARNGLLNNPAKSSRILQMPLPLDTAYTIIKEEQDILKEVLSDGKHDSTLSALESLIAYQNKAKEQKINPKNEIATCNKQESRHGKQDSIGDMFSGWMDSWNGCLGGGFSFDEIFCGGDLSMVANGEDGGNNKENNVESSMLHTIEDLRCNEELVYAIGINPIEERITVVFRGSVTKVDFMTDANINIIHVPEPSLPIDHARKSEANSIIGIHQGFYEYLLVSKHGKLNKYDEIMSHILKLYNQDTNRKNYKVYVCGHSLGGALATLFGYYYAATLKQQLPLPITVVSIASPRVGNLSFARSFTELESQAKIRHLRIANHKDPITLGPTVSSKQALSLGMKIFSPLGYLAMKATGNDGYGDEEKYFHTGMKMKLRKDIPATTSQRCELSYAGTNVLLGSHGRVSQIEDQQDLAAIMEESTPVSILSRSLNAMQDMPMVSYHYGEAYAERMALVETEMAGLTLNRLYREKALLR